MSARCDPSSRAWQRVWQQCAWLLPLLCLGLHAPAAVQATPNYCALAFVHSVPLSPRTPLPRPALAHLNTTHYDHYACAFTFQQYEEAHSDWAACYHAPVVNVHTCPRDCLQALHSPADSNNSASPSPAVLGSGPYHHSSAICLAAIHAGAIAASEGGAVHVDRFWPVDWSGGATQTVWPEQAAQGSVRHGVTSEAVPASEIVVPAPEQSYSWQVRRRGAGPRQVQRAPFSPRSGHLHAVLWPQLQLRANWTAGGTNEDGWASPAYVVSFNYSLHFVIGGRNDTHYLNVTHAAQHQLERHERTTCQARP